MLRRLCRAMSCRMDFTEEYQSGLTERFEIAKTNLTNMRGMTEEVYKNMWAEYRQFMTGHSQWMTLLHFI